MAGTDTKFTDLQPGGEAKCPFAFQDAPMAEDRTEGWAYFRAPGEIFLADDGTWYFTSADAFRLAARNPVDFSAELALDFNLAEPKMIPEAADPPRHARYRRVLDPLFAPGVINRMEDELRRQVGDLIDAFAGRGECDIVSELAIPFPTQVFLTTFGLPLVDRDRLIDLIHILIVEGDIATGQVSEKHADAQATLLDYYRSVVETKRKKPGEDVISHILAVEGDDAWTENELLGAMFMMTHAGLSTVRDTIAAMFYHLAKRPDLRHQLVADPSLMPAFAEEILRIEVPTGFVPRVTRVDVDVDGTTIPAGSRVMMVAGTANRDPKKYAVPDDIDLSQAKVGHVGFGQGIHRCLGSHLARRELQLTLEEFHKRIPDYEIAEGVEPTVQWPAITVGLTSLPLVFASGSG